LPHKNRRFLKRSDIAFRLPPAAQLQTIVPIVSCAHRIPVCSDDFGTFRQVCGGPVSNSAKLVQTEKVNGNCTV
jgi:hypothetical protein